MSRVEPPSCREAGAGAVCGRSETSSSMPPRMYTHLQHAGAALLDMPRQHGSGDVLQPAVGAEPQRSNAAGIRQTLFGTRAGGLS